MQRRCTGSGSRAAGGMALSAAPHLLPPLTRIPLAPLFLSDEGQHRRCDPPGLRVPAGCGGGRAWKRLEHRVSARRTKFWPAPCRADDPDDDERAGQAVASDGKYHDEGERRTCAHEARESGGRSEERAKETIKLNPTSSHKRTSTRYTVQYWED